MQWITKNSAGTGGAGTPGVGVLRKLLLYISPSVRKRYSRDSGNEASPEMSQMIQRSGTSPSSRPELQNGGIVPDPGAGSSSVAST